MKKRVSMDDFDLATIGAGYVVGQKECNGCGACKDICPAGAIIEKGDKVVILKTCIACGKCREICPMEAIKRQKD